MAGKSGQGNFVTKSEIKAILAANCPDFDKVLFEDHKVV